MNHINTWWLPLTWGTPVGRFLFPPQKLVFKSVWQDLIHDHQTGAWTGENSPSFLHSWQQSAVKNWPVWSVEMRSWIWLIKSELMSMCQPPVYHSKSFSRKRSWNMCDKIDWTDQTCHHSQVMFQQKGGGGDWCLLKQKKVLWKRSLVPNVWQPPGPNPCRETLSNCRTLHQSRSQRSKCIVSGKWACATMQIWDTQHHKPTNLYWRWLSLNYAQWWIFTAWQVMKSSSPVTTMLLRMCATCPLINSSTESKAITGLGAEK